MPPLRYFAPNAITALSLLFGLGSITSAVEGNFHLAAWFILWGALLDKLDGGVARLLKATSAFGIEFDSFADFVVFGIAPAALVYYRVLATGHLVGWPKPLLMGAAGLYVLGLGVRLARFNITTAGGDTVFQGFPGTLLGSVIGSAFLTWEKYSKSEDLLKLGPALLIVGAFLMVSTVRLPKVKPRKNKLLNMFQMANLAGAYVFAPMMLFPEYLLFISLLYSVVGAVWCMLHPEPADVSAPVPVPGAQTAALARDVAPESDGGGGAPDSESDAEEEEEPRERLA